MSPEERELFFFQIEQTCGAAPNAAFFASLELFVHHIVKRKQHSGSNANLYQWSLNKQDLRQIERLQHLWELCSQTYRVLYFPTLTAIKFINMLCISLSHEEETLYVYDMDPTMINSKVIYKYQCAKPYQLHEYYTIAKNIVLFKPANYKKATKLQTALIAPAKKPDLEALKALMTDLHAKYPS